jgi:N6-L-threonylcarbamoyladenine synthase
MLILGIESSCDETAIAVVRNGNEVLSSVIRSQIDLHSKWGGVIPEIAAREHLLAIEPLYWSALAEANISPSDLDAIAVTQGPGLVGCLLVGASFAKGLSQTLKKPLIPVNHVHAHIHGALLGVDREFSEIFPTLGLVISGGHTNLYFMSSPTSFKLIAHTIDDACGESFDKVGKMLGLPYPGGPHVEKMARRGAKGIVPMPVMMERKSSMAFSYSGLKTAVSLLLKSNDSPHTKEDIAFAFQEEALGQLTRKLMEAVRLYPESKSVLIAGGVAANARFKEILKASVPLDCLYPDLAYCSDNAAMIAALGYFELCESKETGLHWDVFSRYPFELYK